MTKFYLSLSRYLTVLLLFITTIAWSQSRTVTGKVVSSDDATGLPGVNIIEKGTSNGTVTDSDGNFSVNVGNDATLVFSFVGYASQEVVVGAQNNLNITLEADVTALSEVVVIGYGEVQKRDATGAVATVKAEDFNRGVIASPEQLIQGKTAGVQITSASGEPGAGTNIRIRGTSSVRGGNNPLFVVDGIPLTGGEVSAGGSDFGRGGSASRNPLNFINPNDIESIDILKDASATAIYGSRGANGVVIITTKSGKGKKNQLEYASSLSFSKQAKTYDLLDSTAYLNTIESYGGVPQNFKHNTDWQDVINRTAVSHRHDLSYSNNYKGGNYRASLSYDNQQGIILNSAMERITGRLNMNHAFLEDKLKFGAQLTLSQVNDQAAPITDASGYEGDLIGAAIMTNPTKPATLQQYKGDVANPLALLEYSSDHTKTNRALINLSAGYDITKELSLKVNTGFDRSNSQRGAAYSGRIQNINGVANQGRAFISNLNVASNLLESFLNYNKDLGNSDLSVILGYSYQEFKRYGSNYQGWGFEDYRTGAMVNQLQTGVNVIEGAIYTPWNQWGYSPDDFFASYLFPEPYTTDLGSSTDATYGLNPDPEAVGITSVIGSKWKEIDELQSFFTRVNYNINEKYLFTVSVRADGSTRFGGDNKYGIFPSAAAAWRLSDEDFAPDVFDDLKLRVGYGVTGNQEIPHNLHQQRQRFRGLGINTGNGQVNRQGVETVAFANPALKWEQTTQFNIGLDFGFFSNRLNGSIDVYRKVTQDLLMQIFSAAPAPNPFIWQNLDADVVNNGVELTLNAIAVDKEKVGLNFGFNISYNKNVVENFDGTFDTGQIHGQGLSGAFAQRLANNQPLYAYFLRDFAGYNEAGNSGYYNADGTIDYESGGNQIFTGQSPIPKYNLGFSVTFRYSNFDFSTFLAGQFGHYIYNNATNAYFTAGAINSGRNVTYATLTTGEGKSNAPDVSTRFLEKGDFLRMQNLSIGYNINLDTKYFKKIRLSATGQNVFVITDYTGLDPEVNINKPINGIPSLGIDYTSYPRARTITFGLNATF
jgi:TonB-dependent starch-binding outer membrane protein SusC